MLRGAPQGVLRLVGMMIVIVAVTGCGGSGHKSSTTTKAKTTPKKGSPPAHGAKPARKQVVLTESVKTSHGKTFGPTTKAKPGDNAVLRTIVPPAANHRPQTVRLTIAAGPAASLSVKASIKGRSSTAKVTSANGKPLTLLRPHYACSFPPLPTYCPVKHASLTKGSYQLQFSVPADTPIVIPAIVGPVTLPVRPNRTATAAVVPAYKPTELLESAGPVRPGAKTAPPSPLPTATATVKPGDSVKMITHLTGRPVGAPQATTVTINQGPGQSVKVTASVPGGQSGTATIKSASRAHIELVLPTYVCFISPTPTFCPPTKITAGHHRYVIMFQASPYTPPPVINATVQSG